MWFITRGFLQKLDIDYEETYYHMMDAIIFRYLTHLAVLEGLDMHVMDVVIAYLYKSLDNDIYMKILEGFQMPEATNSKHCSIYSTKLQRSLYRLSNPKTCGTITSMNIWNGSICVISYFSMHIHYVEYLQLL